MTRLREISREEMNNEQQSVFWARPLTYITVGEDIFMVGVCLLLFKILPREKNMCISSS